MTFKVRCPACLRAAHYALNRSVRGTPRGLPSTAPFRDAFAWVRRVVELGCNCGATWAFTIPWKTYAFLKAVQR